MITRRKLAGLFASAIGGLGLGSGAAATASATPSMTAAEFVRLQKWFRDHPELLWATHHATKTELIRQQAMQLSEPFHAANPNIEYSAWVDHTNDNVLLKVYHRDREKNIAVALACAVTRRSIEDATTPAALEDTINGIWTRLTAAINSGEAPRKYEGGATSILSMRTT